MFFEISAKPINANRIETAKIIIAKFILTILLVLLLNRIINNITNPNRPVKMTSKSVIIVGFYTIGIIGAITINLIFIYLF